MAGDSDDESMNEQNQEIVDHVRNAEEIIASTRKRRGVKRNAIEHEFKQRMGAAKLKLAAAYEIRDQKVKKNQSSQWERLHKLLDDRVAVETRIFAILKLLEQAQLNLSRELLAMYDGRLEDLRELTTTGKASGD